MNYPVFAIIYNWKGLKEENYLYTEQELKTFDKELYDDCISDVNNWHDSSKSVLACKTWTGKAILSDEDLKKFLSGEYNDKEDIGDWYWENSQLNDLYAIDSNTMKKALIEFKEV